MLLKKLFKSLFKNLALNKLPSNFKNSIEPAIWKKMTPEQRNKHKKNQIIFARRPWLKKMPRIAAMIPKNINSRYRRVLKKTRSFSRVLVGVKRVKNKLKRRLLLNKKLAFAYKLQAWSGRISSVFNKAKKPLKYKLNDLYPKYISLQKKQKNKVNKFICWNRKLPTYYMEWTRTGDDILIIQTRGAVYLGSAPKPKRVSKSYYGSILVLENELLFNAKNGLKEYKVLRRTSTSAPSTSAVIKENAIIQLYGCMTKAPKHNEQRTINNFNEPTLVKLETKAEKLASIKHIVRLRYRWFFHPRLSKFKLFKKFFKKSLKRYRKISKNKLFIRKFRSHFPRLTGFTEKGLFKLWQPFRRNHNQYWSTNNAVLKFSQMLLLSPNSLLVFLRLSPSLAASKYITKSGAVSINGLAITTLSKLMPGDIMQLNFIIWKSTRHFFDYQRWNNDFRLLQHLPFLQVDWSSLMFMMVRWPRKYELVAPSFLSERWVRYYIRQFPSKVSNFRKADGNWKVYKQLLVKR